MNNIKISVLVPVYNTSKFLEKCLRSIMKQDLKEIEIICVNDGSTDNSLEILNKLAYEDSRIKIISKKNGGLTSARNTALQIAQGKYCLNIDSDDWIEQGYFKAIYERAEKDGLDITISNIIFDYLDESYKNYVLKDLNILNDKIMSSEEYINIFLKENFYGYTWNKLIKTDLYKKNKLEYNENIFMMEDVEIMLRLAKCSKKIGKINEAFYHYVQHQANGGQDVSIKRLKDIKKCFESLINYFDYTNKIVLKLKQRRIITLYNYLRCSFKLKNNLEYREIQKDWIKENKVLPYLKFEYGKVKVDIIYSNFLKIFPYLSAMNFIFIIDTKIVEKLRKVKNIIKR